jgi:hypothetical protein
MRLPLAGLAVVLACACSKSVPEDAPSADRTASPPASAAPVTAQAASINPQAPPAAAAATNAPTWTDPPSWRRGMPKSAMRAAEYAVPRAAGDSEDGECVVYHFGTGQGGGVDENLTRWKGQFPDSTDAKTVTKQVSGMKVTRLELSGTYGGGMPAPGQPAAGPKPHQRMIAAIVEAPAGSWFFKLTGPDATVKAAAAAFDAMIASLH